MIVYMAGPVTGVAFDVANGWREDFAASLFQMEQMAVNPLRGAEHLIIKGTDTGGFPLIEMSYEDSPLSSSKGLFARTMFDLNMAEVVVANLLGAEKVSIGTVMELMRAYDLEKYVIVVMEKEGNVHDHPFIHHIASAIVETMEEAEWLVGTLAGPY